MEQMLELLLAKMEEVETGRKTHRVAIQAMTAKMETSGEAIQELARMDASHKEKMAKIRAWRE
jgi:hypothetical protein